MSPKRFQEMAAWKAACAAAIFAAAVIVATNLVALVARPEPPAPEPAPVAPRIEDARADFPVGWESLPVVAHPRVDAAKRIAMDDFLFSGSSTYRAPLGDVTVEWTVHYCTAGGSSCAQSPKSVDSLRVGDPGSGGAPQVATDVACTETVPFLRNPKNPENQSCSVESMALRRTPDGNTYVVTFRDPDAVERPVASFTRTMPLHGPVRGLARVATERGGAAWRLLPVLLFAAGALALRTARRFSRVLAWREERAIGAMVHVEGKPVRVSVARDADVVLVDPAAAERALVAYRDAPSLDARAVFPASRATADVNARAASVVALVFLVGAAVGAIAVAIV